MQKVETFLLCTTIFLSQMKIKVNSLNIFLLFNFGIHNKLQEIDEKFETIFPWKWR